MIRRSLRTPPIVPLVIASRALRVNSTNRRVIITAIVYPGASVLGLYVLLGHILSSLGYKGAIASAAVIQAMFLNAFLSATRLAEDRRNGLLMRLVGLPTPRFSLVLGWLLADLVLALLSIGMIVLAATLVASMFDPTPGTAILFVGLSVCLGLAIHAGFAWVSLRAKEPFGSIEAMALPNLLLLMLSTSLVPTANFPGWLQPFVEYQPVSLTADALRKYGEGQANIAIGAQPAVLLVVITFASVIASSRALNRSGGAWTGG